MQVQPNIITKSTHGEIRISDHRLTGQGSVISQSVCEFCQETQNLILIQRPNSPDDLHLCQKHRAFYAAEKVRCGSAEEVAQPQIEIKQGKKGIELWAYNCEREKLLHIGSIEGAVYEKQANILQNPKPSFCLTVGELAAILEHGATFLRVACRGRKYAISLQDFQNHGKQYASAWYGAQIRCELVHFQGITTNRKRNRIIDNPTRQTTPLIVPRQLNMFGGR